jgi:hypothetical protein
MTIEYEKNWDEFTHLILVLPVTRSKINGKTRNSMKTESIQTTKRLCGIRS